MQFQTESIAGHSRLGNFSARLIPAWSNRPDSEHEQALIRFAVGLVTALYILNLVFRDGIVAGNDLPILLIIGLFFCSAAGIVTWLILSPGGSVARRLCGMVSDIGAITAAYYFDEQIYAPFFVICLWVIFGNGFRYGRLYLVLSSALSLICSAFVLLFSPYVTTSLPMTLALMVGLVVLPAYVGSLIKRLSAAIKTAEDANRAKSGFLATLSHEIRTPLNGIVGIIDQLDRSGLDASQRHNVELLSKSSEWLMRVLSDGLDFSKIEEGELVLEPVDFDLHETMDELSRFYRGQQTNPDVEFRCLIASDVPRYLHGDQIHLIQVLSNLISNAVKFTEQGFITLEVKTAGGGVRFSISDSGIGVPVEKRETIFEPFRQADSSTSRRYGGTGLGLFICSRLVALMGGELQVQSAPGEGSTFWFTLEMQQVDAVDILNIVESAVPGRIVWLRPPAILLAEDHEINRQVIVEQLTQFGCVVTVASDGLDACRQFADGRFDLILMDCEMPGIDGYEAVRRIRRLESEQGEKRPVPIIALTAHVTKEDRQKCLDAGMDDYLGKPYRVSSLKNKLLKTLSELMQEWSASDDPQGSVASGEPEAFAVMSGSVGREKLHDLRNCLQEVIGRAEIGLLNGDVAENQMQWCQGVIIAAEQAEIISREISKEISEFESQMVDEPTVATGCT